MTKNIVMYKRILFLLCILPFQLLMAQSKLTDFPQGYTPEEVGNRLAYRFMEKYNFKDYVTSVQVYGSTRIIEIDILVMLIHLIGVVPLSMQQSPKTKGWLSCCKISLIRCLRQKRIFCLKRRM